jgi:integrase
MAAFEGTLLLSQSVRGMNERKNMFSRIRYQNGSLTKEPRKKGPDVWVFRWRELGPYGSRVNRKHIIGSIDRYRTRTMAQKAADLLNLNINQDPEAPAKEFTVADLAEHYFTKELGPERHGKTETTCDVYRGFIDKWILPRWGRSKLSDIRTAQVEEWLRQSLRSQNKQRQPLAPGTKSKIRNIFSALFSHAIRWEFASHNPITGPAKGSGVRQSAKRQRRPDVLTVPEIAAILSQLEEPSRSAIFIAASTGFRSSELRGLKWEDVDYDGLAIHLQRGYVRQHVGEMKTEGSKRRVPIAPELNHS